MQCHLLIYDIPQTSTFPNPSSRLRRCAARVNLSCWVVPEGSIPYPLLVQMSDAGVKWQMVAFATSEADKITLMVTQSLRRDIREAIDRARRSAQTLGDRMEQNQTRNGSERWAEHDRYLERIRAMRRRLEDLMNDLRYAGRAFGLDPDTVLTVGEASGAIRTLSRTMEERARAYVRGLRAIRATGRSDAEAMARGVENGAPPCIAADWLADAGEQTESDNLMGAFPPS